MYSLVWIANYAAECSEWCSWARLYSEAGYRLPNLLVGDRPCLIQSYTWEVGTAPVYLPNGVSFRPPALAGCMSVTDRQTDGSWRIHLSQ